MKTKEKSVLKLVTFLVIVWFVYGLLHLFWVHGGAGYPFQNNGLFEAIVMYLPDQLGGWMFVFLCFIGVLIGIEIQKAKVIPNWISLLI